MIRRSFVLLFFMVGFFLLHLSIEAATVYCVGSTGTRIYSISSNFSTGATFTTTSAASATFYSVAVSPDGSTVYASASNGRFYRTVTDFSTGATLTFSAQGPGSALKGVSVSPDGTTVYAGGAGTNGRIYRVATNFSSGATLVASGNGPSAGMQATTVSPDGTTVYGAGGDGKIYRVVTNFASSAALTSTNAGPSSFTAVAVSPDGTTVYGAGGDGKLYRVATNFSSGATLTATAAGPSVFNGVAISPDGTTVYGAGSDGKLYRVATNFSSGATLTATATGPSSFGAVAIALNGATVYGGGSDGKLYQTSTNFSTGATFTASGVGLSGGFTGVALSEKQQAGIIDVANSLFLILDRTVLSDTPISVSLGSSVSPQSFVVTSDRLHAYLADQNGGNVAYILLDYENIYAGQISLKSTITPGGSFAPKAMVLSNDGSYIYVADVGTPAIYRITTSSNTITQIASSSDLNSQIPNGLGINPKGDYLVATLAGSPATVAVIQNPSTSPATTLVTSNIGTSPNAIAFDGTTSTSGNAYVTCSGSNTVVKIPLDGTYSTTSLPLASGSNPTAMSVVQDGSANSYLLIAEPDLAQIEAIGPLSSAFAVAAAKTGLNGAPTQIAVNPSSPTLAYLLQPSTNTVQGINCSSIASITLGTAVSVNSGAICSAATADGSQLWVISGANSSANVFTISGTSLSTATGSPVSSLGTPQSVVLVN